MAVLLKYTRFFRLSLVHITQARFNSSRKGIVFGVFGEKDKEEFELSCNATKYDQFVNGKICQSLNLVADHLKPGKVFIFWDLVPCITAIALVGVGKRHKGINYQERIHEDNEAVRIAASAGCRALQGVGINKIVVDDMGNAEAAAEGSALGLWQFQECKSKQKDLPEVELLSVNEYESKEIIPNWNYGISKANAQNFARMLTDMPGNLMTPTIFSDTVKLAFQNLCVEVAIHERDWIESKCMNSFLAVAKGSSEPPKFLELSYSQGNEKVRPILLVGKGITFDSGGISIKPAKSMDEMRGDMGGAATCVAALKCIAESCIDVNLRVLIPLCENMPSCKAVKPGDVVRASNGKTICVNNTDAEGRLILADGLSYAAKFDPRLVVSVATLTGAMRVAIGNAATGVFANNDKMYEKLEQAAICTGDRVWRFPLWKQYTDEITQQPGYDVNNIGKGVGGGACTAAAFLKEFVPEKYSYLHLDIAGVFGPSSEIPYLHKGMTGRPTRTLIEFLRMFQNSL